MVYVGGLDLESRGAGRCRTDVPIMRSDGLRTAGVPAAAKSVGDQRTRRRRFFLRTALELSDPDPRRFQLLSVGTPGTSSPRRRADWPRSRSLAADVCDAASMPARSGSCEAIASRMALCSS